MYYIRADEIGTNKKKKTKKLPVEFTPPGSLHYTYNIQYMGHYNIHNMILYTYR